MPKKKPPPEDPKDYYINNKVTLDDLVRAYRGKKGCSKRQLAERSRREKWLELRQEQSNRVAIKTTEKTAEKIAERTAKTLSELNEEHNALVEQLVGMGRGLLNQYITIDKDTGKKKLNCKSSEYRAVAQTILDLIHAQRLFHNFDPNKPMEGTGGDKPDVSGGIDKLMEVLERGRPS
jgi:hypothetical protein